MQIDVWTQVWGVLLGIGSETYTKHWKFIGPGIGFWEVNTQLTTDILTLHCSWPVPDFAFGSDMPDTLCSVFTCDHLKLAACIES